MNTKSLSMVTLAVSLVFFLTASPTFSLPLCSNPNICTPSASCSTFCLVEGPGGRFIESSCGEMCSNPPCDCQNLSGQESSLVTGGSVVSSGNDTVHSNAGYDRTYASIGIDTADCASGNTWHFEESGGEHLSDESGSDSARGDSSADACYGES